MKFFIVVSAVMAVATAASLVSPISYAAYPYAYAAPVAISSQYQAQDAFGQYHYGYINPLSAKTEVRSIDGVTRGGYSYVDAAGKLQSVQYSSDAVNGFRVAATNLPLAPEVPKVAPPAQPTPVEDSPEVAAAPEDSEVRAPAAPAIRSSIISAPLSLPAVHAYPYGFHAPVLGYPYYGYAGPVIAPSALVGGVTSLPVAPSDTAEVVAARAQHLAAIEQVKARNL